MLERFTLRENELNRLESDRVVRIIRIFSDETGEFTSFDELLQQSAPKKLDLLFGLHLELLEILTA